MIPSRQEVTYRVYGAWLLARFDARGVQYFDDSPNAAFRSFYAAVLTAPAFIVISLLSLATSELKEDMPAFIVLVVHTLFYVLLWVVAPVIIHRICQVIDRGDAFFRYLSANNWSNIITYHLNLVMVVLILGEILPAPVVGLLIFATYGYVIAYNWFIGLRCLDINALTAAGLVGLQLVLHVLIESIVLDILTQSAS
jgi:hypothetical protein